MKLCGILNIAKCSWQTEAGICTYAEDCKNCESADDCDQQQGLWKRKTDKAQKK